MDIPPVDWVLVPGVAFSRDGHRVGMGKGFFDRFLEKKKDRFTAIGLAYDFQLVDKIQPNPWDQPMDRIFTESEEIVVPAGTK